MKVSWKTFWLVCFLGMLALGMSGCATTESENLSSRPWNQPPSWQFGVPGMDRMH